MLVETFAGIKSSVLRIISVGKMYNLTANEAGIKLTRLLTFTAIWNFMGSTKDYLHVSPTWHKLVPFYEWKNNCKNAQA
jgi:hypothetical protein